ncbi:polyprenyl synthetase family protein [Bacteriovoracaceae bacterium]|nr:polyprenyl synthetase family protein [Bacteriovoracaceae bacterium]
MNNHQAIEKLITNFLKLNLPKLHAQSYHYSVLPAGKLFRPLLMQSIAKDLGANIESNHSLDHIMVALELHHAYTLIHDDLPSMDNDDMRRGKESCHKKFGEWKAILTGDGLLNLSYGALSNIDEHLALKTLKLFSSNLGPKGLIQGQILDLSQSATTIEDILEVHILKTSKLFEVSTIAGLWVARNNNSLRETIDFMKIGRKIGLIFQILDDLGELLDEQITEHEKDINIFIRDDKKSFVLLHKYQSELELLFNKYELNSTAHFFSNYFQKSMSNIKKGQSKIALHIKNINLLDNLLTNSNSYFA